MPLVVHDLEAIKAEAERQIVDEDFNFLVQAEKAKLRTYRPWWHKMFPFVITIRRRK